MIQIKRLLLPLIFIFLLISSGCSTIPENLSYNSTNVNSSINNSSLTENFKSVNEVSLADKLNESSDTYSKTNISVFEKKNISKIEFLEKEFEFAANGKKVYGKNFITKSTVSNTDVLNKMSKYLFSDAILKFSDGWAKFNPAHANYKAINVYCDDNTKYVINLHFSENSETKYIAVATVDSNANYNDFVNQDGAADSFEKCIANQEFAEFLIKLF